MSLCKASIGICTRKDCPHFHPNDDQRNEAIRQRTQKGTDRVCGYFPNCKYPNCNRIHIYGKIIRKPVGGLQFRHEAPKITPTPNEKPQTNETKSETKNQEARDFTTDELKGMLKWLQDKEVYAQVNYCMYNLRKFAKEAADGEEFKMAHFAYNLGRVQEILQPLEESNECWWHRFEPLLKGPYAKLSELAQDISKKLGLVN